MVSFSLACIVSIASRSVLFKARRVDKECLLINRKAKCYFIKDKHLMP